MSVDPGESYDAAARNPELVKTLMKRISEALSSFPEEVRKANAKLIQPAR